MGRKVAVTFIMGLDCLYDVSEPLPANGAAPASLARELPAPIFALEVPCEAYAGVPFSLNAWVGLTDPLAIHDEILPGTFKAELDPRTQRIVVTGRVRRPAPGEVRQGGPRVERALVVGIPLVAPAGMYALDIPPTHYTPTAGLALDTTDTPPPRATQWLQVRPERA